MTTSYFLDKGKIDLHQVPWHKYSEEEIQTVVIKLFKDKGYDVYNVHKIDRRGEKGADLECSKQGETDKLLIAVKKKPGKSDIYQLQQLADREYRNKIYIYVEEPSVEFKKAMNKLSRQISFWNSEKLTLETFNADIRFYIWLIVENIIWKSSYKITLAFYKIYKEIEDRKLEAKEKDKMSSELLNLLWNAKDRSVSLYKSLGTLQEVFECMNLPTEIDEKTKASIVNGFLRGLMLLQRNSLEPLELLFNEIIKKYQSIFIQFCIQTKGRSNWLHFFTNVPNLVPGLIIKSFEEAEKESDKFEETLVENNLPSVIYGLSDILGDIARELSIIAYFFEDTVDDLLSIALLGEWTAMRDLTPDWLRNWEFEQGITYSSEQETTTDNSEKKKKT